MIADRYTKVVLSIIAVALTVIAARPWLPGSGVLQAVGPGAAQAQGAVPKYEVSVPKEWGKFIAFSNNNLLLEAADHSWRVVDVDGKPPEYPKIKVLIHWQ
jgi:hypothetical protein